MCFRKQNRGNTNRIRSSGSWDPVPTSALKEAGWAAVLPDAQGCPGIRSLESCLGPFLFFLEEEIIGVFMTQ